MLIAPSRRQIFPAILLHVLALHLVYVLLSYHLSHLVSILALHLIEENEQASERNSGRAQFVHKVKESGHEQLRTLIVPVVRQEDIYEAEKDTRECILDQVVSLFTALRLACCFIYRLELLFLKAKAVLLYIHF